MEEASVYAPGSLWRTQPSSMSKIYSYILIITAIYLEINA